MCDRTVERSCRQPLVSLLNMTRAQHHRRCSRLRSGTCGSPAHRSAPRRRGATSLVPGRDGAVTRSRSLSDGIEKVDQLFRQEQLASARAAACSAWTASAGAARRVSQESSKLGLRKNKARILDLFQALDEPGHHNPGASSRPRRARAGAVCTAWISCLMCWTPATTTRRFRRAEEARCP